MYCLEKVPGAGRTCIKQETPPKECRKQGTGAAGPPGPPAGTPGLDAVPVVGGGLQQGANQASSAAPGAPNRNSTSGVSPRAPGQEESSALASGTTM